MRRAIPKCSLEGCLRPNHARGLCQPHYDLERHKTRKPAFVFTTDFETYDAVKAIAKRDKCTLTEVIRTFVEWGLETEHEEHRRHSR